MDQIDFRQMIGDMRMLEREKVAILVLVEILDSINRLVELAESDYAEDEERMPASLGER